MGFATKAAINTAIAAGQIERCRIHHVTNSGNKAAGNASEEFTGGTSVPPAGTWSGSAGVATAMTRSTTGAFPLGPNVSPKTRHLSRFSASNASGMVPSTIQLVDFLLYYPACVLTGTPTTLDNSVTLPRYTTGEGVMAGIFTHTTIGATGVTVTANYDTDAATGITDSLLTVNATSVGAAMQTAAGPIGKACLQVGADSGIKKINSYTLPGTTTTGTVVFVLYKPICEIPLAEVNTAFIADAFNRIPSMERIYDDACLGVLCHGISNAGSILRLSLEMIWG